MQKENSKYGLTTVLPILVSVIAASVAIYTLSSQLQQQNNLERKKVEAAYLTKALEDINAPPDMLMKLAQDTHAFKNRLNFAPEERSNNIAAGEKISAELQQSIKRYSTNMLLATYFAELIEQGSVLRSGGRNELFDRLQQAQDTAVELMQIVPDAQSEKIPISELSKHPLYQKSEAANHAAAKALIRRLQEMYGTR